MNESELVHHEKNVSAIKMAQGFRVLKVHFRNQQFQDSNSERFNDDSGFVLDILVLSFGSSTTSAPESLQKYIVE